MKADKLLDEILLIIRTVKEDEKALQKILDFLQKEVPVSAEDEEDEVQLPVKYNKVVKEIAGSIDAGLVCYLNPDTLETDELPPDLLFDSSIEEDETEISEDELNLKYTHWEKYITIEPLESNESYKMMKKFVYQLDDSILRTQLVNAVNDHKPFINFKRIVDNSTIRQDWFDFKDKYLQRYVRSIIEIQIQDELN